MIHSKVWRKYTFYQCPLSIETILNDFNCVESTDLLESLNTGFDINLKIFFLAINGAKAPIYT